MHARGRYANLRRIEALDPALDHDQIFRLLTRYEFPWEYVQGTSIAFMRDFGVPSISALLDRTGEFEHHGQKRYDDTILIGFEATVDTLESPRGRAAIRHLNRIHGRYDIPEDEFVYVLATTIVGPKRFIDAHGWRPLHPHEIEAMHRVTTRFGELMGIKDLPESYDGYEQFLDAYEATRFEYAPSNERVAEASIRIVTNWYPRPLRPLVRRISIAMLDDPLVEALGLPPQPRWLRRLLDTALRLRSFALRTVVPPRPEGRPYEHDASRTYPFGYSLSDLGPSWAGTWTTARESDPRG
ncbi:MAG TPA: oxygenase MpaB family protein [Nocardioidaceae bacterium]|nr:oxygenase MpaB family protein [Nocardioidaceae bacterium]